MIYDCFMFFNELDLLEIRFNILDPYVDYFVVGQSTETFSGVDKPIYFNSDDERWSKWKHKIINIITPKLSADNAFERAKFQKERLKDGLINASDEDIIYYGDLDEIWDPRIVKDTVLNDKKVYSLEQINYCYYLNNRSSERWVGTIVGKWGTIKTNEFCHWRATHTNEIPECGWHFTNMGGLEQIVKKLGAYDHQEYNIYEVINNLKLKMRHGEDYVGRTTDWEGKRFVMWIDEEDLPSYIISNKEKYANYFKS